MAFKVPTSDPLAIFDPPRPEPVEAQLLREWHGDEASQRDTVMVVDDDPIIRELSGAHLEYMLPGYKIVSAENGLHALELLQENLAERLALAITDKDMPRVNGFEFAEGLKGINGYGHVLSRNIRSQLNRIPVVMQTADNAVFASGTRENETANGLLRANIIHAFVNKGDGPMGLRKGVGQAVRHMYGFGR